MKSIPWIAAYFSPTGTTRKVALAIAQGSGCPVLEADLSLPRPRDPGAEDALLLAVAPVFGGRVPKAALERLSQFQSRGRKAVAVVVYGNRAYDDALLELKDALEENGCQVIAAAAFVAEHSVIREIAAGRPNANDLDRAAAFGSAVMEKLSKGDAGSVQVPGDPGYRKKQSGGGQPFHPTGGSGCTRCGECAKRCPLGAIPAEDPAKVIGKKCINCMRCVAVCPRQARSLPAPMLAAAGAMLRKKAAVPRAPEVFL